MTKMEIKLERIFKEVVLENKNQIELEAQGSVHKEGTLLGRDRIEAQIILRGEGVRDILTHFPAKLPKFMAILQKTRIIGRNLEIVIYD